MMLQTAKPNAQPDPEPGVSQIVAVAQRVATQQGYPRKCRVPACKRAQRCVHPHVRCLIDETQSLPVRVFARRVAAGRRLLREAETQAECSDALAEAKPQSNAGLKAGLMPTIQALLSCIGKGAD